MALHEYKKCAKILEEMTEYLLGKGYKKLETKMELMDTETKIIFTVYTNGNPISETLKKDLFCCRDAELEEYGWELSGEIDCVCTLDSLGLLVDRYDMVETDETCVITLHRVSE